MNSKSIFFEPANHHEIEDIICNMENKNGRNYNINTKSLKTLVEYLIDALIQVIPIHKSKEKHIVTNYRPISLISNPAKILEKIIHKQITTFISKCDILDKNQYGFRKNKSTKDALTLISKVIYGKLDKSTPIVIIFLDLVKAFDT